jgi:hypothetical protein
MGKDIDQLLSVGGDILGFVPGFQWAPMLGNAISSADEISRGDFLTPILQNVVGPMAGKAAGQLGGEAVSAATGSALPTAEGLNLASQVTGQSSDFLMKHAYNPAEALGSAAASSAGSMGAQRALEPGLASILGLSGPTASSAPATAKLSSPSSGGGSGAGGAPGGLDIKGSTAPGIYPWVGGSAGGAPASGGAVPGMVPQQKGI